MSAVLNPVQAVEVVEAVRAARGGRRPAAVASAG
jgi:hypothetical protein